MNLFGVQQSQLRFDSSVIIEEENECNVVGEEEEALDALKAL